MAFGWDQGIAAGSTILGMIGQNARAKTQHGRQKELMGVQFNNQSKLNKQGSDLQYDMWKKTNAPAQVGMLKEAGLNAGLMYGQSGPGGQTGSQGGGSAQSGSAAAPMDIGNSIQAGLMAAQTRNLDADTAEKNQRTNTGASIEGKNIKELDVMEADIAQKMANTKNATELAELNRQKQEVEAAKVKLTEAQTGNVKASTGLTEAKTEQTESLTALYNKGRAPSSNPMNDYKAKAMEEAERIVKEEGGDAWEKFKEWFTRAPEQEQMEEVEDIIEENDETWFQDNKKQGKYIRKRGKGKFPSDYIGKQRTTSRR